MLPGKRHPENQKSKIDFTKIRNFEKAKNMKAHGKAWEIDLQSVSDGSGMNL